MYQEKKEEQASPLLRIAWRNQYWDNKKKKEQRKLHFSNIKQQNQEKHQQNDNSKVIKLGRKTYVFLFQATN